MLTPYDEFPVHQYSQPFSVMPVSDFNWDDGYYFGVYSADAGIHLYSGLRVTPNADMVGAYAGVNRNGVQRTVRSSRIWRPDFDTAVGPIRYEFEEPFKTIRLVLEPNESELSFDIRWLALSPPHQEEHHVARNRGRLTTDQTRYSQTGTAEGWIEIDGERIEVRPHEWYSMRDHSWGLYEPRSPLSDPAKWLPPKEKTAGRRALRFWMPFESRELGGFYQFHEDEHGGQGGLNDVFGTPFEGLLHLHDEEGTSIRLVSGQHDLRFKPGTRLMQGGTIDLVDEHGREWRQELEVAIPPWLTFPIGYYEGTWKDGGNIHTYHGPDNPYVEWDEFDFSDQPTSHRDYNGREYKGIYGGEYLVRVHTDGPDGFTSDGLAQIEFFVHRTHGRYGEEPVAPAEDGGGSGISSGDAPK